MATEPDKTLTPSLRAEAVPNWRLFKTTCFNKVWWCDLEYTQKNAFVTCSSILLCYFLLHLRSVFFSTVQTVWRLCSLPQVNCLHFYCIFSVDSFWHFHSYYRNASLYSIFLARSPDPLLCICEQIYCLVQIYDEAMISL